MKPVLPFALLVCFFAGCSSVPPEAAAVCEQALCRTPNIKLNVGASQPFTSVGHVPVPFLQHDLISIFPGEEVFVLASVEMGQVKLLQATPRNTDVASTFVFKLTQVPGKQDMVLEVINPFKTDVKFEMGYMSPRSAVIQGTSSCPAAAGLHIFEHWPFPIFQLLIRNPAVLPASEPHNCA